MKSLSRCLLLCLAMLALPVQGIAGTVMMICGATTAATPMMSRHAAIKSQIEAEWDRQDPRLHCHEEGSAADGAGPHMDHGADAAVGDGDAGDGLGHHHADAGCGACAACALGAALPTMPADLALSHYRHIPPRSALPALAGITADTLLRPPSVRF